MCKLKKIEEMNLKSKNLMIKTRRVKVLFCKWTFGKLISKFEYINNGYFKTKHFKCLKIRKESWIFEEKILNLN